ncbi:MAG: response regulator, partial [Litorimonas sp.]
APDPSHDPEPPRAVEPERDFERRALPIENDEAVLGNNWRDAVIAKATGGEDAVPEEIGLMAGDDPSPAPSADGIRILLAEDNAINALLTRTLLEADGHSVETVEDGQLAVEAMKRSSYDMIFMDMRMPNMDGLEATRNIRRLPNVPQDLPIVALTANAFDDDRNACFDSGMNDFMTKPVSAEELSEMVVRWTQQEAERKIAS